MANIQVLSSLDAPELDVYARLTQAQLRNRLEPEKGVFIAESPKVIRTALDAGLSPVSFLMEQRHIARCCAPSRPLSGHSGLYGRSGYPRRSHRLYAHAGCSVRDAPPRTKGACGRSERCAARCGFRECSGRDEHRSDLPLGSGAGHGRSAAYLHVLRPADPARGAREHGHGFPDSMGCAG